MAYKSLRYDRNVAEDIEQWLKRQQKRIRPRIFDARDPIPRIRLQFDFIFACVSNGIDDGAATKFFHFLSKSLFATAVKTPLCPKPTLFSSMVTQKQENLRSFPEIAYLFQCNGSDEVIVETDAGINALYLTVDHVANVICRSPSYQVD